MVMLRYNQGKAKMSFVPAALMRACARVLEYGVKKYARDNWRKGGNWTEVMDSLLRHAFAFNEGEDVDPESGLSHLDHMAANIAFLCEFKEKGVATDNRFKPQKVRGK
jgi:hypothetical protein